MHILIYLKNTSCICIFFYWNTHNDIINIAPLYTIYNFFFNHILCPYYHHHIFIFMLLPLKSLVYNTSLTAPHTNHTPSQSQTPSPINLPLLAHTICEGSGEGTFSNTISLPPGEWTYKFVVDGEWRASFKQVMHTTHASMCEDSSPSRRKPHFPFEMNFS